MWFEVRFKALLVRPAVANGKLYTEEKKIWMSKQRSPLAASSSNYTLDLSCFFLIRGT